MAGVVERLSVVYLYVADLERSLGFYRDLLGIPLEISPHDDGWAEADLGAARFALHLAHAGAEPRTPNSIRVSLEVRDVEQAVERLRAAGVETSAIQREAWGSLATVVDPDGYEIGLFAPPALSITAT